MKRTRKAASQKRESQGVPLIVDIARRPSWGLPQARAAAERLLTDSDRRKATGALVRLLHTAQGELRKRAADVARRVSDKEPGFFEPFVDQIAAILAEVPQGENRTRWHLALVAARAAKSPAQIAFVAELMWMLTRDPNIVVRCSAVEGLGRLAARDRSVQAQAVDFLYATLRDQSPAIRCRARDALRRLKLDA